MAYHGFSINVNTDLKNSTEFENSNNHQLLSAVLFESKYPLQRQNNSKRSILTPIMSTRYSPNKSKNIKDLDRRISYDNVYSLDRIGENNMVEGGFSITMGSEFSYLSKTQQEIYKKQKKDETNIQFIIWIIAVIAVLFFGVVLRGAPLLLFILWPIIWFFYSKNK